MFYGKANYYYYMKVTLTGITTFKQELQNSLMEGVTPLIIQDFQAYKIQNCKTHWKNVID